MKKILVSLLIILSVSSFTFANGGKDDGTLRVGVTVGDIGNPFFNQIGEGVKFAANQLSPNSAVTILSSNYDLSRQSSQIDNFISSGTKILILNAADTEGIAPAVRRAKEAGLIIVAVDVDAEGGVDATVTTDNVAAGAEVAKYLVNVLEGKGEIVIINGPPVSAVIDRVNGAMKVFSQYPDIKILSDNQNAGGSRDGGLRVMSDLLTSFQNIDGVFAINDPTGIGADLAARQAGRSDELVIVGVDGAPDAVVALEDPDSRFIASSAQNPFTMAQTAFEIAFAIYKGEMESGIKELIPVEVVTRDNVDSYQGWTKKSGL